MDEMISIASIFAMSNFVIRPNFQFNNQNSIWEISFSVKKDIYWIFDELQKRFPLSSKMNKAIIVFLLQIDVE